MNSMELWRFVLALSVTLVLIGVPALAQSTAPGPASSPGPTDGGTAVAPAPTAAGAESSKPESSKAPVKRKRSARSEAGREEVRAIQQALKDRGFDPGDADGAMGPKTRAALRDFQRQEGLRVTGRMDAETRARLGVGGVTAVSGTRPGLEVRPTGGEPSSAAATSPGASATTPAPGSPPPGAPAR